MQWPLPAGAARVKGRRERTASGLCESASCLKTPTRTLNGDQGGERGLPSQYVPGVQIVAFEEVTSQLTAMPSASGIQIEAIQV